MNFHKIYSQDYGYALFKSFERLDLRSIGPLVYQTLGL